MTDVSQLRVVHCPVNMGGIPATNVQALRRRGVDARLVLFRPPRLRSDHVDMVLNVPDGLVRRQAVQLRAFARLLPQTDVFHFYFGLTLLPKAIQFPVLRAAGRKSVFHFLGSDIRRKTPAELAFARRADARIVGSYDAARWLPDADVVPPGIHLDDFVPVPPSDRGRPRVVHAPSNREKKGTEYVIEACKQLPVDLDIVHGVPNDEAVKRYAAADIVVDQLLRDWHGVFALEAMAMGKPVVTSLDAEAVRKTEAAFGVELPIVAATKENLAERLRPLVESPEERRRRGEAGRAYVERVHDIDRVADGLIEIYRRL